MHPELAEAIREFRADQELALAFIHGELEVPVPCSAVKWAANGHEQVNQVRSVAESRGVTLYVHGFGIEVSHPQFHIDFDYGRDGQTDCFDTWRLSLHRHLRLGIADPVDDSRPIKAWLHEAAEAGELVRIEYSMYFDPSLRSGWTNRTQVGGDR